MAFNYRDPDQESDEDLEIHDSNEKSLPKKKKRLNPNWQEEGHDTRFFNSQAKDIKDEIFSDSNFFPKD